MHQSRGELDLEKLSFDDPSQPLGAYARRAAKAILDSPTLSIPLNHPSLKTDRAKYFDTLAQSKSFAKQRWSDSFVFESKRAEMAAKARLDQYDAKMKAEKAFKQSWLSRIWSRPSHQVAPPPTITKPVIVVDPKLINAPEINSVPDQATNA